jgi:hypothetical protein
MASSQERKGREGEKGRARLGGAPWVAKGRCLLGSVVLLCGRTRDYCLRRCCSWGRRDGEKREEKEKEGKEEKRKKKMWKIFPSLKIFERKIKDNLWSWKNIFIKERYMHN